MSHSLNQRRNVLIIGASSSIGRGVINAFVEDGYRVIASCHNTPLDISESEGVSLSLDLTSPESIGRFTNQLLQRKEKIDVAVFLSGVLPGKSLEEYDATEIDQVMVTNFSGQVLLLKGLLSIFAAGSSVLMMSSISGERGSYDPVYAASKGAIIAFVKSMATWLAPRVRFNALAPGLIESSTMHQNMEQSRIKNHRDQTPMDELLNPDDLARILVDLARPHWRYVNGAVISVNGGAYV